MTVEETERTMLEWRRDHFGILLKVARSFAESRDDQEDLVQEILIQLWLSLERYEGQCKPSTWIYRVALNTAMSWQRGERRRRNRVEKIIALEAYWQEPKEAENPGLELLYELIHRLAPHERYLVLLYLEDLQYAEIAEIIGISESNVGVRISRVRKKLVELCKERGEP